VASLLFMRSSSQQAMLDGFFSNVHGQCLPVHAVSDRAFATARSHLHAPALQGLNDWVIERADAAGLVSRWRGFRLVAGDASVLMPAIRRCKRTRHLADADQRLFALHLPGSELMLHAAVHSASLSERAMLMEALDKLGPQDVLLLDRGYPAAWLVNVLVERGIRFVIRCDTTAGGFTAVRRFMRSGQAEAQVALNAPDAADATDWGCSSQAPTVRLVSQIAPSGAQRVLMTNLSTAEAAAADFGDLYHRRWRIEEAFKRLKHRLHLEAVSGLSQHAVLIDVAAKVLADNIAALLCLAVQADDVCPQARRCARASADNAVRSMLPRVLLAIGDVLGLIAQTAELIARSLRRASKKPRSSPRKPSSVKPHARLAYKG
jgi:hypothetical protein